MKKEIPPGGGGSFDEYVVACVVESAVYSVLQCASVCCNVLHCVAICSGLCGRVSCLKCVAVCCSVLQCVAACHIESLV